jgi:hypothetical protein
MDKAAVATLKQEPNVKEFMEKPIRPNVLSAAMHRHMGTRPA